MSELSPIDPEIAGTYLIKVISYENIMQKNSPKPRFGLYKAFSTSFSASRVSSAITIMTSTLILANIVTTYTPNLPYGQAWAQTIYGNSLFANATVPVSGNQSIVPGIHVMTLVNGVKPTWIIISSDNELSVNLRYSGNGTAPPLSLLATAIKTGPSGQPTESAGVPAGSVAPNLSGFQRLTGSNVTNAGWMSPATIPIRVEGGISLYDADLIIVMAVPYTSSSNSSIAGSLPK